MGISGQKTVVGHGIGHVDETLGVGCVMCIKHCDFGETTRNTNYLSAVCDICFLCTRYQLFQITSFKKIILVLGSELVKE